MPIDVEERRETARTILARPRCKHPISCDVDCRRCLERYEAEEIAEWLAIVDAERRRARASSDGNAEEPSASCTPLAHRWTGGDPVSDLFGPWDVCSICRVHRCDMLRVCALEQVASTVTMTLAKRCEHASEAARMLDGLVSSRVFDTQMTSDLAAVRREVAGAVGAPTPTWAQTVGKGA